MDLYILLLSVYSSQYLAILVLRYIFLLYFHSILQYLHNILLPKTFYFHTYISSLNAYRISSMNFFLSNISLYLIHYILVVSTTANIYDLTLYVLLLFLSYITILYVINYYVYLPYKNHPFFIFELELLLFYQERIFFHLFNFYLSST